MKDYLIGWRRFNIKREDTVLEVGSGAWPCIRSDILCDKYINTSFERPFCAPVVIDRPFVVGDAEALPFKTKSVDFLYCSQLAEHIQRPQGFFQECMRVASKGVIRTPSILAEKLFGWDIHAVMYEAENDTLVIHRKNLSNWQIFGSDFHQLWLDDKPFRRVVDRHPEMFMFEFEWEGEIRYRFAPLENKDDLAWTPNTGDDHIAEEPPSLAESTRRMLRSVLSSVMRRWILGRRKMDIYSILCCPACHGELEFSKQSCKCESCGRIYEIKNNIPVMLV